MTESDLIDAGGATVETLAQLRAEGVHVAVDDIGAGHSSVGYLRSLPITTLKVDRSFVGNITVDGTDAAITETIVRLAQRLGLQAIAEGVESEEQVDHRSSQGVAHAQGCFYGRPVPEAELRAWLRKRPNVKML